LNLDQIALQLYTIRSRTQQDMIGALRDVAAIGYRNVELAGYGDSEPRAIRTTLDELGMRAISAHTPLEQLLHEPERQLDELQTLGCEYAVLPSVGADRRSSVAAAQQLAEDLNQIGARCRDAGLGFAYHNHAFEFEPLEGTTFWNLLIGETDPSLVALELDVAWADVGGHDPAGLLQRLGERVVLLHAKDHQGGAGFVDMPIGDGVLAWPAILAAAGEAGVHYYIVEQDNPRDPLNDVRRSYKALRRLAGEA
jgi:sugar phosphate isomerase/epimerase